MKKIILIFTLLIFTAGMAYGAALSEGFEGTWPPTDWTIIQGPDSPTNDITQNSDQAYSGSYSARFSSYSSASGYDEYLITPQLVTTSGDQTISFWYRGYSWGSEVFKVGWSSTGTDVSTDFTWSAEISDASTTWQQYSKTDLPVGTKYVAIHYYSDYQYYLYVDDVAGPEVYVGAYPKPTDLATTNITQTTADLGWTEAGTATTWEVEWGPTGFTQGTGTTITGITSNPYTLNPPLTAGTTYDWYVRSDCGGGNYSDWAGAATFTTQFVPVTSFPWTEGFEDDAWVGTPSAPPGWSQITVSGSNVWTRNNSSYAAHTGDYSAKAPWAYSGGEHYLITLPLDLSGGNYRLKFWLDGSISAGTDLYVKAGTSNSNPASFTDELASYIAGTNMPSSYEEQEIDLSAYSGTTYIAFRMVDDNGYSLYIDDITIEEIPTTPVFSITPDSLGFGTVQIGTTSDTTYFTISNIGGGTLTIDPAISITGTDPSEFTLVDTNSYPMNLAAGEEMYVGVAFAPTSMGEKTANLHIVDNTSKATHDIPLTGTGWNYNYGGGGTGQGGYYFANSTGGASGAPSQPTYNWIDITTTGIEIPTLCADDEYWALDLNTLGFSFTHFGTTWGDDAGENLYISSNGWMRFDTGCTSSSFSNTDLPTPTFENGIMPFWDDLDPSDAIDGNVYYKLMDDGTLVVEYYLVPKNGGSAATSNTFEAIFYPPNGNIKFQYLNGAMLSDLTSSTVGIQGGDGDPTTDPNNGYVTYLYNGDGGPLQGSGLAVMFGTDENTLPVELIAGSLTAQFATENDHNFVNLSWATASETDLQGFNVYRASTIDLSEANQVNVTLIPGAGNSTETQEYSFADITADVYVNSYYWLEMVDLDGNSFYGPVTYNPQEQEIPENIETTILRNCQPNPVRDEVSIAYQIKGSSSEQNAELRVYNIQGRLVKTVNSDNGIFEFSTSNLSTGIYFYQLKTESFNQIRKMVITK